MSGFTSVAAVRACMLDKLKDSGLDEADAKTLGMRPCINGTATELTGYDIPGFQIPYFNMHGKETTFFRYRRLEAQKGKKLKTKYFQPKGTGVSVYFPPFADWAALAKDATKAIILTEGELKSACATKRGFYTLGLGGVWSFMSKAKGQDLIPDLAQIDWAGRTVYICFDSDAMTNSLVMQAECALAKQLFAHGAKPYIIRLPTLKEGSKTGLDDYLMANNGGDKKFHHLIEHAQSWAIASALHEFNREVIFIRDPGVTVIRGTGQRIDVRSMVGAVYANRLYMKPTPTTKDPLKRTETSVPAEWLKWTGRAEAHRMTYAPGKGELTDKGEYNMWKGWGCKPKRGSIAPWRTLLDYLFKDVPKEHRTYFEQWLAYPLQHPGTKLFTSAVLWSTAQGTGKSLVGYTMAKIYGDNFAEIGDSDIASAFNHYATNRQFVMGDEITGNGGNEKRQIANKLKSMITQQVVTVNQKYVPNYEIPDCINYLWTSNHCDAFFMENEDRRFFVHEVTGAPLEGSWYRDVYDPWYKSISGAAALFYHLLHLDMTGFDPRAAAPMTDSKMQMIEESRSDLADWVESLPTMQGAKEYTTSEELLLLATGQGKAGTWWTKNSISRAMHSAGYARPLGVQQVRLEDGRQIRPWCLDRTKKWLKSEVSRARMLSLWYECHVKTTAAMHKKFQADAPAPYETKLKKR